MRVYEFSKQFNIPLKTVMQLLTDARVPIKSHMSVLDEKALALLEKHVANLKKNYPPQKSSNETDTMQQKVPLKKSSPTQIISPEHKVVTEASVAKTTTRSEVPEKSVEHQTVVEKKPIYLESQTVSDFAQAAHKSINEVIITLLSWGVVASKNQHISEAIVARLAKQYDLAAVQRPAAIHETAALAQKQVVGEEFKKRFPIVVVIGHVDHGKTTLLDFIRKTRVAAREKGGITQHLGAYQVATGHGDLVFLDTPGHEAFSKMRQRGVRVADIAVLVVAADDGVMPQTVEAIKHARQMDVPVVVAANKIDKVGKERIDVIKRQLAQHDVLVEDWGGSVVLVPISAKTGEGVSHLLDLIVLQAELMDLRADTNGQAKGFVLEAHIEKGLGPVATLITQQGILRVGDYFHAGYVSGRVTSIVDSFGKRLAHVEPSIPVRVAGFSELPNAGDLFAVVSKQEYKNVQDRDERRVASSAGKQRLHTQALNVLIKTDTNSSKEAILGSLEALAKKNNVHFNVIHAAAGDISESDIELASTTGADIIGLHVKAEAKALQFAQRKGVNITLYDIIYRLLEALEERVKPKEQTVLVKTKVGEARVLKTFDIKNIGVVAGCIVADGRITRDGFAIIWRGAKKIGEGKIESLQRDKRTVKEVYSGFECGFIVEGVTDWKVDDRVECYAMVPSDAKK